MLVVAYGTGAYCDCGQVSKVAAQRLEGRLHGKDKGPSPQGSRGGSDSIVRIYNFRRGLGGLEGKEVPADR